MNVLMAMPGNGDSAASNFKRMILDIPEINITGICRSIEELHQKLRSPWDFFDLVILFADSHNDMKTFVSFRDLLEGFPLLLVLPDRNDDISLMGHQLHPRFISYADGDFSDVAAVLKKMVKRQQGGRMAEATGGD